jgi:tRNA (guanine-N7-)-methyltransferase
VVAAEKNAKPAGSLANSTPENLVFELPSILERIRLEQLFPKTQPLELELGSGDGSFLLESASLHPERNFLGIERLLGRIRKLDRKGRRLALMNLRGIRIECAYFLQYLLPPHSATALHVYFPDPWPKRRHSHHRLINERFPSLAAQALVPGAFVYLRTDNQPYYQEMVRVFEADGAFTKVETPVALQERLTDFERDFRSGGVRTFRAAFRWEG